MSRFIYYNPECYYAECHYVKCRAAHFGYLNCKNLTKAVRSLSKDKAIS